MKLPGLEIERSVWSLGVELLAGVDEAGRGPLAGPVVAAAVMFPKDFVLDEVDDSKKLTAIKREELFEQIKSHATGIGMGIVGNETIDRINILQATILAMREAIENLAPAPQFVIVDGNSFNHKSIGFENIIDGDAKSFTIAAASIIAKVTRDRLMQEYDSQFPAYGFAKNKGYGTKDHLEAVKTHGMCEIHRRSFKVHSDSDDLTLELPFPENATRSHNL
ncbi:MAG: ribonuclease HII [Bacteroidota bacterium]